MLLVTHMRICSFCYLDNLAETRRRSKELMQQWEIKRQRQEQERREREEQERKAHEIEYPQVPCKSCSTLILEWYAKREDYRFPRPFESESKGLCEDCKSQLYLKRFASLQIAYRDWLAATYPTPSYIYGLLDPRTREMCYIGRTADIAKRMASHRREAQWEGNAKAGWINELHDLGLTFEHCILAVVEPGYHVVEQEARWICEGIQRGWPLRNGQAIKQVFAESIRQPGLDYWTHPYQDLSGFDKPTMARIRAYAAWSEQMLPALPHRWVMDGESGLMYHEASQAYPGL
jgi:hypothetical protein